jgi:hypothetical protein
MEVLAGRYPGYGWERNAGYATPDHIAGLAARGITPHHRRSFCRVSQTELALGAPDADAGAPAVEGAALAALLDDLRRTDPPSDAETLDPHA